MPVDGLRLLVPRSHVFEGLAPEVAAAFEAACSALSRAGARITDRALPELDEIPKINAAGGFAPIEAYAWHRDLIARRGGDYDPRVRGRIERARDMTAVEYIELRDARADLIARMAPLTAGFDAMLMPTVAITAPPIAAFAGDADYRRLNALILRNCSAINFLDRCAATVPIQKPGDAPVGLMIVGEHGGDRRLLAVARGIEAALGSSESGPPASQLPRESATAAQALPVPCGGGHLANNPGIRAQAIPSQDQVGLLRLH